MSQLALVVDYDLHDEPQIYSFAEFASRREETLCFVSEKARLQKQNQNCPICNRVTVESIELNNGTLGRNGRMIPGTGTLVGFSCNACGHEWPLASHSGLR